MYLFFTLASTGSLRSQIAVIVHKSVAIDSASAAQVADMYRLKTRKWQDGKRIVLYNLKAKNTTKEKFYKFIDENPLNLRKLWMRLQLTGEATPPHALETEEQVVKEVATTPGAIGYVRRQMVNDNVKIIAVIE